MPAPVLTSPSLLTSTSQVTSQGNRPLYPCHVAFDDLTVSPPTWTDMSARLRDWSTDRGGDSELELMNAGACRVTLDNRDRALDPANLPLALTVSGNEITDALRAADAHGDGRSWPAIEFYGDFESGNERQWDFLEVFSAPDQFAVVTTPVRDGTYAGRFTVRSGDTVSGGERAEVRRSSGYGVDDPDGFDIWYAWSTLFPAGWTHTTNWQIFRQHHSDSRFGQAPFMFRVGTGVNEGKLELRAVSGNYANAANALAGTGADYDATYTLLAAPLTLETWHDFVVRINWRTTSTGSIEVWHRLQGGTFTKVAEDFNVQTIPTITGDPTPGEITDKIGLYRNDSAFTSILYHDGYRVGHSFEEVAYDYPRAGADSSMGVYAAHTNLIENSGAETNLDGTGNSGAGITRTRDATRSKFGGWSFKAACDGTSSSQGYYFNKIDGTRFAVTAGLIYTAAAWVSAEIPSAQVKLEIEWWSSAPALISTSTMTGRPPRSGFDRLPWSLTATAPVGAVTARVRVANSVAVAINFWVDGVDFKQKPYVTSHVHTDGASAAHSAARVQGPATLLDETQSWVAFHARPAWGSGTEPGGGSGTEALFYWEDDASNRFRFVYDESANTFSLQRTSGGTTNTRTVSYAPQGWQPFTVVAAWTSTQLKLSVDGAVFSTTASTAIPTLTDALFDIFSRDGSNEHFNGDVLWFACGVGTLTDADAATIHAFGDTDPSEADFPVDSECLLVWDGETADAGGSPYDVVPRRRLWLRAQWAGVTYDLFQGVIQDWPLEWRDGVDSVVEVDAIDYIAVPSSDALPTTDPPRDSYADVVEFDKPYHYCRMNDAVGAMTAQAVVGVASPVSPLPTNAPTFGVPGAILGDLDTACEFPLGKHLFWELPGWQWEGQSQVTIEAWIKMNTIAAGASDVFEATRTGFGPDFSLELAATSAAPVFKLGIEDGTTNVIVASTTGTALTLGVWTHVVCTWDNTTMRVYQNGVQTNSAAQGGTINVQPPIYTAASPHMGTGSHAYVLDEFAVYAYALSAARVTAHYQAGADRGRPGETTHVRLGELLQETSVAYVLRNFRTSTRTLQTRYYGGQSPSNEIDAAVLAEGTDALFFNAKSGAFTFLDRDYRSASPWSSVQATFDDRGVAGVPYTDASLASGEAFIFNDVRVTREGGELQRTFDTASIARFGRRVLSRDGLIVNSDADASTEATDLLAKYKDPFRRISAITLAPRSETAVQLFTRELGDYVRVIRHPPGGGVLDQSSYIRRIHLESDPNRKWPAGSFSITPR